MLELHDRIEERFGDGGAIIFMILVYLCLVVILILWLSLLYFYPLVGASIPFVGVGLMILMSRKRSE